MQCLQNSPHILWYLQKCPYITTSFKQFCIHTHCQNSELNMLILVFLVNLLANYKIGAFIIPKIQNCPLYTHCHIQTDLHLSTAILMNYWTQSKLNYTLEPSPHINTFMHICLTSFTTLPFSCNSHIMPCNISSHTNCLFVH